MKIPARKDLLFVSIQLLLFVIYMYPLADFFFHPHIILQYIALGFSIIGLLVIAVAILQLDKNLTPFPSPKKDGTLIQTGLYKFIRHPIYSGIIFTSLNFGLYNGSSWKIGVGFALWILFYFKSRYEEYLLTSQFPGYEDYRKRTYRFFPLI